MFGLLRPQQSHLKRGERVGYQSAYCNLCGSIAAEYGVSARMLVLYDFASLAWLLEGEAAVPPPLPRLNCVRGGVRAARGALRAQDRFLAAASVYTCGVKIQDDLQDQNSRRSRLAGRYYRTSFEQARDDLVQMKFDVKQIEGFLAQQRELESRQEWRLDVASQPTGAAYALVARHFAHLSSAAVPPELAAQLGDCLGRCVYLVDAYRDREADFGVSYNPLWCSDGQLTPEARKRELVRYVVDLIRATDRVLPAAPAEALMRWVALRDRLLRLLGVEPRSVVLNAVCGAPCGEGFAVCDGDECTSLVVSCCCWGCICCCLAQACQAGSP